VNFLPLARRAWSRNYSVTLLELAVTAAVSLSCDAVTCSLGGSSVVNFLPLARRAWSRNYSVTLLELAVTA
jgi:hypothetical protein